MPDGGSSRKVFRFAEVLVDTATHEVCCDGKPVTLPPLSYRLLLALVEDAPALLSHDDLVEKVWRGRYVTQETITQRIKLLRRAIGDNAAKPRYIGLVRGEGYRLLPPVEKCPAPERVQAPSPAGRRKLPAGRSTAALASLLCLVGVLILVGPAPVDSVSEPEISVASGRSHPDDRQQAADFNEKANFLYQRRSVGDVARAREYYQKAIASDDHYAPAWVGLCATYLLDVRAGTSADPVGDRRAASAALRRAMLLDPDAADVHAVASLLHKERGAHEQAAFNIRRAMELEPDNPRVLDIYAGFLARQGKFSESAEARLQAAELDPLSALYHFNAASTLLAAGRLEEAAQQAHEVRALAPGDSDVLSLLTEIEARRGGFSQALSLLRSLPETPRNLTIAAIVHHGLGQMEAYRRCVVELGRNPSVLTLAHLAEVEAALGNPVAVKATLQELQHRYAEQPQQRRDIREALRLLAYSAWLEIPYSLNDLRAVFEDTLSSQAVLDLGAVAAPGVSLSGTPAPDGGKL